MAGIALLQGEGLIDQAVCHHNYSKMLEKESKQDREGVRESERKRWMNGKMKREGEMAKHCRDRQM